METLTLVKRRQFKQSESDKIEPNRLKRQRFNKRDNEEGNSLNEDKGEIESARYVPPPFVPLSPLFQKLSNRLSNLGEGTISKNHLIYIPKIYYSRSAQFALEFLGRGGSKAQKKNLY